MATYPIHNRGWTRAEYDQLIARGSFRPDERLELLGGQLVVREPQGSRHAVAIELALRALQRAFGPAKLTAPSHAFQRGAAGRRPQIRGR